MPRLASLDRLRAAALTLMLLQHFTKWLAGDPRQILPGWEGFAFTDVCAPAFAAAAGASAWLFAEGRLLKGESTPRVLGTVARRYLLLIPIGIVLAKWVRRRRRRRRGSPTQRAIGAWRETMDRLRAHGVPTSNAMTASELAWSSSQTVGDEAARRLYEFTPVLDSVLYQPDPPDDQLADTAWDAEAGVADAIKHQYGPMARFRARIDPRPLFRRT